MSPQLEICDVGGADIGLVLPLFGEAENKLSRILRTIIYLLFLFWFFLGVALISDVFMGAIETITSKKARKFNTVTGRWVTYLIWNPTVANLTLMALGSSAPEILLSVIELFGNDMLAGDLGPSTIVGSAAFNLLMIIAVCVSSIPGGEVRAIKEVCVYAITATFSIFAYLWLLFILQGSSPHVVHPAEGVMTFVFFPVFIGLAYLADIGYFSKPGMFPGARGSVLSSDMSKDELAEIEAQLRKEIGKDFTEEAMQNLLKMEAMGQQTRAHYRVGAIRNLTGGKRVQAIAKPLNDAARRSSRSFCSRAFVSCTGSSTNLGEKVSTSKQVVPIDNSEDAIISAQKKVVFEFSASRFAVLENAGTAMITVTRSHDETAVAKVGYRTREGTAKKGEDFIHAEGYLTFAAGETKHVIKVTLVDDNAYEDDEEFYVDLFNPTILEGMCDNGIIMDAELGNNYSAMVVIIDDDRPGVISFVDDTLSFEEQDQDWEMDVDVLRKHGSTGRVTCRYYTEDDSAIAGRDYEKLDGTLVMDSNETQASIRLSLKARGRYDRVESFRLILADLSDGAKFDAETDGGAKSCILTVQIQSGQKAKDRMDRIMSNMQSSWEKTKLGSNSWREQFVAALYVNGGEDDELEGPTWQDYVMHAITVPWKMLFAFVPPTDYYHGWACFVCSLMMIGLVTAFIGDLAALLGCVIGVWPAEVTAITFVALGTSLPDTFASKTAAEQDPFADASVGNVTGSNSVNVFLGLGLPWMVGSIYWSHRAPNQTWLDAYANDPQIPLAIINGERAVFIVKAGALAPSVCIFAICGLVCILILYARRRVFGGELGGPKRWAWLTSGALVTLWVAYVAGASMYALKERDRRLTAVRSP